MHAVSIHLYNTQTYEQKEWKRHGDSCCVNEEQAHDGRTF